MSPDRRAMQIQEDTRRLVEMKEGVIAAEDARIAAEAVAIMQEMRDPTKADEPLPPELSDRRTQLLGRMDWSIEATKKLTATYKAANRLKKRFEESGTIHPEDVDAWIAASNEAIAIK